MFGLGMGELLVILAVALLVLGPKRLPDMATGLGKAIRDFRRATQDIQSHLAADDSVARPLAELKSALHDSPAPLPRVRPAAPPQGDTVPTGLAVAPALAEPATAAVAGDAPADSDPSTAKA